MDQMTKYQKHRIDKMDGVQTSVNIERRHKVFLEKNNINLSQVARDAVDDLMAQEDKSAKKQNKSS